MIITPAALRALYSSTLTPLNEYDTVELRNVREFIVNGFLWVTCEVHDHGYAFIMETNESFWLRTGEPSAVLPETPTRPDKALGGTNYKKFM